MHDFILLDLQVTLLWSSGLGLCHLTHSPYLLTNPALCLLYVAAQLPAWPLVTRWTRALVPVCRT